MTVINFIQEHSGWAHTILLNAFSIAASFSSIEANLKITLLIISILYTLWRWFQDYKKSLK